MGIAKITRNFQITIPRDIRRMIKLKEGDEIVFNIDNNKICLIKTNRNTIEATSGLWINMKETGAEYQKRIRTGWKRRKNKLE